MEKRVIIFLLSVMLIVGEFDMYCFFFVIVNFYYSLLFLSNSYNLYQTGKLSILET